MRSYGQFCALARALDVVGDRWTLLIVRELFARDSRYSDLRDALPGIATNLLAERLRQLKEAGVIEAYDAPSPIRATVYRLTPEDVISARRCGRSLLGPSADGNGAGRRRLSYAVARDGRTDPLRRVDVADLAPLTVLVEVGDEPATIEVSREGLGMELGGPTSEAQVEVAGEPEQVFEFLTGTLDARTDGLRVRGAREAVRRLRTLTTRSPLAETDPSRGQHRV